MKKEPGICSGEKDNLFNKWCLGNWTATCKRMKLDHYLIPYTKINSKLIKEVSVRPETIKLLGENIGSKLLGKDFLDLTHRAKAAKFKIHK